MNFTQLHIHANAGSRLDAVASSEDYAKKAKELGHTHLALTDHGKLSGFYDHQKACDKFDLIPVFGVEMYINDKLMILDEKGKRQRIPNNHIILLAENQIGYKNLLKLNYISMNDTDHFYYRNHITFEELFAHSEGLIVGTACMASPFSRLFREGKEEEAEVLYNKFIEKFGKNNFYTELQLNEIISEEKVQGAIEGQKTINSFMESLADKYGITKVLTGDVHYLNDGDDWLQTVSLGIQDGSTYDNIKFELEGKHLFYHTIDDYKIFNKKWNYGYSDEYIEDLCNNAYEISKRCNVRIPERTKMILPTVTENDSKNLIKLAREGLIKKLNKKTLEEVDKEYRDRLEKELEVLLRKGMASYVLILEDIFRATKKEGLMAGAGRGSGAGSLVLYALGITTIDPLRFGLLFERFLSDSRSPDYVFQYFL